MGTANEQHDGKIVKTDVSFTSADNKLADMLAPRPLLMIVGTEAATKWMSEDAVKQAREPKELFWIEGSTHVELYDKPEYVTPAVAKMTDFFRSNLAA